VLRAVDPRRCRRSRAVPPCRVSVVPVLWAARAGPVQMGRGQEIGPLTLFYFFYFLNIFKFLQIQKFVYDLFEFRKF
jgi:hypothetical protein